MSLYAFQCQSPTYLGVKSNIGIVDQKVSVCPENNHILKSFQENGLRKIKKVVS